MGQSSLIAENKDWVVVGRVGRPFGVKGWLHIHSFTDIPDRLFTYTQWHLKHPKGSAMPVAVETHKPHASAYTAKLVNLDDRDLAAAWTNADILVSRTELPELPEGEYYFQDLIGLSVYNFSGHCFGLIEEVWETKANDVLIVKCSETGKETLIPYVPEAHDIEVDFETERLIVDWPEDF